MRATVVLVAALVVVGAGAPFAAAASGFDGPAATVGSAAVQDDDATNESDSETAPGAQLAGVASVQGADVEGEVERRSFGLQVAAANSNSSKARVVANQTERLEARLADLEERKATLEEARDNGSISASRYRAEMAGLSARISALQRLSNDASESARGLPDEALEEKGVDTESIERLRTSAENLSGPEVAEVARGIAGPSDGTDGQAGDGDGPPFGLPGESNENGTVGPPDDVPGGGDDVENATDDIEDTTDDVENATDDIEDTTDDVVENATDDVQNSTDDVVENSTDDVEDSIDDVENSTDDVVENATDGLVDDSGDADDDSDDETTTLLSVGADWRVAATPLY